MSELTIYQTILIFYAFLGSVYWLWLAVGAVRVASLPILADLATQEPERWPRLSVIIPACNEAEAIEAAAKTLLAQDYPELQVILVDDRSTDDTGPIIERIAAADRRARAVHIDHLPENWLGKVHALATGCDHAMGDLLLFTDADVHYAPGALRRAVAYVEAEDVDHLALMPDIWPSSLVLDASVAAFMRTFPVAMRCWAVSDPDSDASIGIGAFNLVRRTAFLRTDGFVWLRLEVADDLGLGLMMKRSGARSAVLGGRGLLGLYWYRTLAEMARGAEKGYASVGNCSPAVMIVTTVALLALEWAPLVMLLPLGMPGLWLAGVLMLVAAAVAGAVVAHRAGRRLLPFLLWPLTAPLGAWLMLRTCWLGWRRGGVVWRGTLYASPQLRAGRRIRLL